MAEFDCEKAIARVREIQGPWAHLDPTTPEGERHIRASYQPDLHYKPIAGFAEARESHSLDEFLHWIRDYYSAWVDYKMELLEAECVGERVIVQVRLKGRGRGSGVPMSGEVFQVNELRDGKVASLEDHLTREGAVRAAEQCTSE